MLTKTYCSSCLMLKIGVIILHARFLFEGLNANWAQYIYILQMTLTTD